MQHSPQYDVKHSTRRFIRREVLIKSKSLSTEINVKIVYFSKGCRQITEIQLVLIRYFVQWMVNKNIFPGKLQLISKKWTVQSRIIHENAPSNKYQNYIGPHFCPKKMYPYTNEFNHRLSVVSIKILACQTDSDIFNLYYGLAPFSSHRYRTQTLCDRVDHRWALFK